MEFPDVTTTYQIRGDDFGKATTAETRDRVNGRWSRAVLSNVSPNVRDPIMSRLAHRVAVGS